MHKIRTNQRNDYGRFAVDDQSKPRIDRSLRFELAKQRRLLPTGALPGFDGGNRRHATRCARSPPGENMRWRAGPIRIGPTGSASASDLIIW